MPMYRKDGALVEAREVRRELAPDIRNWSRGKVRVQAGNNRWVLKDRLGAFSTFSGDILAAGYKPIELTS